MNKEVIIKLYQKYKNVISLLNDFYDNEIDNFNGMYLREECKILFMFMREIRPRLIYEISPHRGWATIHIQRALADEWIDNKMFSFEINEEFLNDFNKNLSLYKNVVGVLGDAMQTFKPIADREGLADFILIDHGHYSELNQWCFDNIFNYLKVGGYVLIHDIHAPSNDVTNIFKHMDFLKEYLPESDFDETSLFLEWLQNNDDSYEKLLITDLIVDEDYIEKVKPFGGGNLTLQKSLSERFGIPKKEGYKYIFESVPEAGGEDILYINANPSMWLRRIK